MSAQGKSIGQNDLAEVLTGALVVAVLAIVLVFIYAGSGSGNLSGYELLAKVPNVAGLGVGTDVRLSGIKIGSISDMTLDTNNFLVTIHMDIRKDIQIPTDSSMQVTQAGILGGQYISITPGGDDKNIPPGGMLATAQGSVDLMGLAARFIGNDNGQAAKPQPAGQAPVQQAPSTQQTPAQKP
jgi:phospholipid/cholesterol/gamma-HCH transport system substrate-binding protein